MSQTLQKLDLPKCGRPVFAIAICMIALVSVIWWTFGRQLGAANGVTWTDGPAKGTVSLTVVDEKGLPVEGSVIRLQGQDGWVGDWFTNAKGEAEFISTVPRIRKLYISQYLAIDRSSVLTGGYLPLDKGMTISARVPRASIGTGPHLFDNER